ncbi:MAG TPA: hypothetical protein VGR12_03445 [Solirubrobacteraceae bacterium]|nr:hypothetical protein [Solirubrobacteraceae bacterium]
MNTVLIIVTLVEVLLLVVVLAGYLIAIGTTLHKISKTLGLVTFGVRAIESQTASIGPSLTAINGALEQVAGALEEVVGETDPDAKASAGEGVESRDDLPRPATP